MVNFKINKIIFVLKYIIIIKIINIFWKWLLGLCEGLNYLWDVFVYDIRTEYIWYIKCKYMSIVLEIIRVFSVYLN